MIPLNNGTVDYFSSVSTVIDRLVTSGSPVFLTEGNRLLTAIGLIMLVIFAIRATTSVVSAHHPVFDLPGLVHFFALFLVAESLLRYYNTSLPWAGSSVSSLLPDTARQYAAWIDVTALNTLSARVTTILAGAEQPGLGNVFLVPVYFSSIGFLVLVQALLFAITVLGFVAIGIGTLLGPLFIPWLLVPRMSWLFWNWISFMLQYSFYKVLASALTFIWANVIVAFIDNTIAGDFTMAHFLLLLVPLTTLFMGMAVTVFKITSLSNDLFRGSASAVAVMGDKVSTAVKSAVGAAFA